ncbi:hypothetical protein JCM1393_06700 [Clostridium carnis]
MSNDINKNPKVSIIVAAYNIEDFISRCMESLVNQTLKDIEIIVVNDGSKDNTLAKILDYEIKDYRIKVINKKNQGLIEARKTGLNNAKGEYLLFVDGDDWLKKNCCEELYNKAKETDVDIVYYNLIIAKNNKLIEDKSFDFGLVDEYKYLTLVLENKIRANVFLQFIRSNFLKEKNIILPSNVSYGEDLAITVTLAIKKPKVAYLNKEMYYYFQRAGSITGKISNKVFEVESVIDYIKVLLENEKIMEDFREGFNYLAFIHLYYYRIIRANYVMDIHKKLYYKWKEKGIKLDKSNSIYYREICKKASLETKLKISLYNKSYYLGRIYTNSKYIITFIPKLLIKKII